MVNILKMMENPRQTKKNQTSVTQKDMWMISQTKVFILNKYFHVHHMPASPIFHVKLNLEPKLGFV